MTARCPELLPDGSRCVLDMWHYDHVDGVEAGVPHQSSTAYTRGLEEQNFMLRRELHAVDAQLSMLEAEIARLLGEVTS